MQPFHYAFKVRDLESTRRFYVELLGCAEGRSTDTWVDFNFFGHQLSAHVSADLPAPDPCGEVDGIRVPIPHFGCVLQPEQFLAVSERLEAAQAHFVVRPRSRYEGGPGEQQTLFVLDESGNPLEFKALQDPSQLFEGGRSATPQAED